MRGGIFVAVFSLASSCGGKLRSHEPDIVDTTRESIEVVPIEPLLHPFHLSMLDGSNGVRFKGIDDRDHSGYSVSGAGDVNGDGYTDMLIGAPKAEPGKHAVLSGETYLIYGGPGLGVVTEGVFDLGSLDGASGVRFVGVSGSDWSGFSVSGAGDVNADGYDDVLIGAPFASSEGGMSAGEAYLVYGGKDLGVVTEGVFDLATLDGKNGVRIKGIFEYNRSGFSVSGAGDVNGDGYADMLIGAPFANRTDFGGHPKGQTCLVYGGPGVGSSGVLDLATLDGTNGVVIEGIEVNGLSGGSVSGAGDVNGDGYADLLIGAWGTYPGAGGFGNYWAFTDVVYVVFGGQAVGSSGVFDLSTLDGKSGMRLEGLKAGEISGIRVSGAGDVNGDGYADLLAGAPRTGVGKHGDAGVSYLVYGGPDLGGAVDLSTLDASGGLRIDGIDAGDWSGWSVSGPGDVNGDGYADLLIGGLAADPCGRSTAGETYLVYGGPSIAKEGVMDLAALDGSNGVLFMGIEANDKSGFSVSGAGDVNGDGYADLLVGSMAGPVATGESYLVYGAAQVEGEGEAHPFVEKTCPSSKDQPVPGRFP